MSHAACTLTTPGLCLASGGTGTLDSFTNQAGARPGCRSIIHSQARRRHGLYHHPRWPQPHAASHASAGGAEGLRVSTASLLGLQPCGRPTGRPPSHGGLCTAMRVSACAAMLVSYEGLCYAMCCSAWQTRHQGHSKVTTAAVRCPGRAQRGPNCRQNTWEGNGREQHRRRACSGRHECVPSQTMERVAPVVLVQLYNQQRSLRIVRSLVLSDRHWRCHMEIRWYLRARHRLLMPLHRFKLHPGEHERDGVDTVS